MQSNSLYLSPLSTMNNFNILWRCVALLCLEIYSNCSIEFCARVCVVCPLLIAVLTVFPLTRYDTNSNWSLTIHWHTTALFRIGVVLRSREFVWFIWFCLCSRKIEDTQLLGFCNNKISCWCGFCVHFTRSFYPFFTFMMAICRYMVH